MPSARRKKDGEDYDDEDQKEEASAAVKQPKGGRQYWRGARIRCSGGKKTGAGNHAPVSEQWEPVENSDWVGALVRTVGETLQSCYLNRTWWVSEVRQCKTSGVLQLKLADRFAAVGYALASQVVRCAADADLTPVGPSVLDYRVFKPPQRRQLAERLCNSLGRDVELGSRGQMLEQTTVAWGLQEIQLRLPCTGVQFLSAAEVEKGREGAQEQFFDSVSLFCMHFSYHFPQFFFIGFLQFS